MTHYQRRDTYPSTDAAPSPMCEVCGEPWPCEDGGERVMRDEVDEVRDLFDLLAPGRSTPIEPEHVERARDIVERLARMAGVR